jgi:hypothetical protein
MILAKVPSQDIATVPKNLAQDWKLLNYLLSGWTWTCLKIWK